MPLGNTVLHVRGQAGMALTTTSSSGLFELSQFAINFRSSNISPFLQIVGANFQKFRILSLIATACSYLPTTVGGICAFGYFPDPYLTPTDFDQVVSAQNSKVFKPYQNISFKLRVSKAWFYVALENSEQRLSDVGSLVHVTQEFTSALVPGTIIFNCSVEFSTPISG